MKTFARIFTTILLLGAGGFGIYRLQGLLGNTRGESNEAATYRVIRRSVEDRVVERGTVESQNTVYGKCELPTWQNKIIFIVPEGTVVKKGDVVARLQAEEIDQQIQAKTVELNEARGKRDQAQQELEIQINKGKSDIATAQLEFDLAVLDLEKYEMGDFVAEKAELERAIKEAEAELEKVRDEMHNIEILVKKGYRSPQQLREYQLRENSWQFRVEHDLQQLKVLVVYDKKRQMKEKKANAVESELKLERAKKTAAAEHKKNEAAVANAKNAVELHEQQLKEMEATKEKCTLKAAQDGTVAYANQRWYDPSERIREGTTVRSQQDIYYLPDMANMQVKANVHESVVDRIQVGQKAMIRLDAFADMKLQGSVKYVSELAATGYRDAKNYDAVIVIEEIPEGMAIKPGMTAEVDILVGTYEDIIAVPVGAVTEHFQQTFVYLLDGDKGERQAVKTGRMTHAFVEIVEGLEVGDVVALDAYQRGTADFAEAERDAGEGASQPGEAGAAGGPGGA